MSFVRMRTRSRNGAAPTAPAKAPTEEKKPMTLEEMSFDNYREDGSMYEKELVRKILTNGNGGHWLLIVTYNTIDRNGSVTDTKLAIIAVSRAAAGHLYVRQRINCNSDRACKIAENLLAWIPIEDVQRIMIACLGQLPEKEFNEVAVTMNNTNG